MSAPKPADECACISATHDVLFAASSSQSELRCDVCNEPIADSDDEGYSVTGRGLYIWTRGSEVRREQAPLCPRCATGIGAFFFARAEIEEEED